MLLSFSLWTCLYVLQQLGQVELPLLTEAGELQQEADGVVSLVQTRQTLNRSHCVEALRRKKIEVQHVDTDICGFGCDTFYITV